MYIILYYKQYYHIIQGTLYDIIKSFCTETKYKKIGKTGDP